MDTSPFTHRRTPRQWRRRFPLLLAVAAVLTIAVFAGSGRAFADTNNLPPIPENETLTEPDHLPAVPEYSVRWDGITTEKAFEEIAKQSGMRLCIDPAIRGKLGIVSLRATRQTLDTVLRLLLWASSGTRAKYRVVDKTIYVEPKVLDARGLPVKDVQLSVTDAPIASVLEALFRDTGVGYTVDADVSGTVTVDTHGAVPFTQALDTVLASCRPIPLHYLLPTKAGETVVRVLPVRPFARRDPFREGLTLTRQWENYPLMMALQTFAPTVDTSAVPWVKEELVTMTFTELAVEKALGRVLESASHPLTYYYHADEGVLYIVPAQEALEESPRK